MKKETTRRSFLTKAAAVGVGAAVMGGVAAPAIAKTISKSKIEMKMLTVWPKNYPGVGSGAERFAKRISEATDGRISIKVYGAGEIVAPFEVLDTVSGGSADLSHDTSYYWIGKDRAFVYFAVVPFGMSADEHFSWLHYGGGQELWDKLGAKFGVKPLAVGNTGAQMGGWFRNPVTKLADLKGLRLRYPGLGGELMKKAGATPVSVPGGELFTSLQSGAIDGLEWISPWNDLAFGFHRVAKNYYYPGFHEMGHCVSSYVNLDVWESLSKSDQKIFELTARAEYIEMLGEYNARNVAALERLVTKEGVNVQPWPADILEKMKEITPGVMAENAKQSPMAAKVSESWTTFRKDQKKWLNISTYKNADLKRL